MPTSSTKSLPTLAVELKDLVVTYAKQETLQPIKSLGRFVTWGILGSILLANGLVLLVLALLRGLQTELPEVFDGNWSFAPYLITFVVCLFVLFLAVRGIGAAKRRRTART